MRLVLHSMHPFARTNLVLLMIQLVVVVVSYHCLLVVPVALLLCINHPYHHHHNQIYVTSAFSLIPPQKIIIPLSSSSSSSLSIIRRTRTTRHDNNQGWDQRQQQSTPTTVMMTSSPSSSSSSTINPNELNDELNRILLSSSSSSTQQQSDSTTLRQAIIYIQEHSDTIQLNKSNWDTIFTCIEEVTAVNGIVPYNDNENGNSNNSVSSTTNAVGAGGGVSVEFPIQSIIRQDMTDMYQLLATLPLSSSSSSDDNVPEQVRQQQELLPPTSTTLNKEPALRLFGAVSTTNPPASFATTTTTQNPNGATTGSSSNNNISPQLFEQILQLPMKSLTPSSSNTVLYIGIGVAFIEGLLSLTTGINYNFLVMATLLYIVFDRFILNGISMETVCKIISPELQQRIYHHEAGHFLVAYLLGCPIESIVVSAYAALQNPRYNTNRSFTAGTSFFDPILSEQMNSSFRSPTTGRGSGGVTRSSIDRYSMIVMAGIAAEADQYGQADGGASDEYALIAFLSQLRSNNSRQQQQNSIWNSDSIRNQARYGAVQAMLLLRQYRPAYEALVTALQYGGTLKDCIYAIEQAGRIHNLPTRYNRQPMGYINSTMNTSHNSNNDDSFDEASTWTPNTHNNTFIHN